MRRHAPCKLAPHTSVCTLYADTPLTRPSAATQPLRPHPPSTNTTPTLATPLNRPSVRPHASNFEHKSLYESSVLEIEKKEK